MASRLGFPSPSERAVSHPRNADSSEKTSSGLSSWSVCPQSSARPETFVVGLADHALCTPKGEQRRRDPRLRIGRVVLQVDARRRPVILADRVAAGRVAVAAQVFREEVRRGRARGLGLALDVVAQKIFRIRRDQPFRQGMGLDEEEPPEIPGGEGLVGAGVHRRRGGDVEQGEALDPLRMVQGQAVGDAPAPVVTDDGEPVVAERPHHRHRVRRHGALGVRGVALPARGLVRIAVAAQVHGHDHAALGQARGDVEPGRQGLRVAVQ